MTARLFEPLKIGGLTLENRIIVAPMCQYSAQDGNATDWHIMHFGQMTQSGAGLFVLEATAVSPEARITNWDLGLYSEENEAALARALEAAALHGDVPMAVQLAHAGRKASCARPWHGGGQIAAQDPAGWQTVSASALPFDPANPAPTALDAEGLRKVREDFVAAALRARRLGLRGIELHMAHGYLLHQFLSPLSNQREDAYGGSLENRLRFPVEVFKAVSDAVGADIPVWVRISASDWVEGGWDVESSIALAKALKAEGLEAIHVSSGGLSLQQKITLGPNYQVGFAREIRAATGLTTIAVGLITEPAQAEKILTEGEADAIGLARAMLYDPRWPWHAAAELGATVKAPPQYWRCQPHELKSLFKTTV